MFIFWETRERKETMIKQLFSRRGHAETTKDFGNNYNINMEPNSDLTINIGTNIRIVIVTDDSGVATVKVQKMVPNWETVDVISPYGNAV